MKKIHYLLALALLVTGIVSCSDKQQRDDRFEINENDSNLEVKIERFDRDVFALDTAHMAQGIAQLQTKYGAFFDLYTQGIMRFGSPDSAEFVPIFKAFLSDSLFREVYQESLNVFEDVSGIEKKLTTAFKYIKHYFPEKEVPHIYMHVSGFNQQVVTDAGILSISIDDYLGADYILYQQLEGIYPYQLIAMTPEKVPSDYILGYLQTEFPINSNSEVLLDNMLYMGKIMYLLEVFMPGESEETLMAYTPEQLQWCYDNEKGVWAYMAENKHLFSTERMMLAKYLNDAPFTSFFSKQSPGRIGTWIGLQIVRSYMKSNPDKTLRDLVAETDYQQLLSASRYQP